MLKRLVLYIKKKQDFSIFIRNEKEFNIILELLTKNDIKYKLFNRFSENVVFNFRFDYSVNYDCSINNFEPETSINYKHYYELHYYDPLHIENLSNLILKHKIKTLNEKRNKNNK